MKKLSNLKWFTLGILACLLVTTLAVPALAASLTKTAQLTYNSIKITLNGSAVTPKDAAGNVVEPFIIDGTTYLPVRAVANVLGIGVGWDGVTNTVQLTNATSSPSGTIIYENNGIKITYLGIAERKYGGEEVKLYIENSSEKNYTVQTDDESVNGIMTDSIFSCDVAAGKSAYDSIEFPDYVLEDSNITSVNTVDFIFRIYNADSWSDYFESGIITIKK
ncbi:MAG: stalk domain-containing protein [Oscillospiraceae bacterium]|nr:stalk domain-containing protein [Oscillospiraceae bacterium]